MKLVISVLIIWIASCSPEGHSTMAMRLAMVNDDTSFVYSFPYEKGRSFLLIQGYMTIFSHKNEYALDFKMKKGTKVCAARSGVVIQTKADSDKGGLRSKYLGEGNHIIILHS